MNLIRLEPFTDMRQMIERALDDEIRPSLWRGLAGTTHMPMDMYQTNDEVVVKATIPGVKPEDVDITITGDTLTIKAESKTEEETQKADYIHRERRYGSSTRTVSLPHDIKTDNADASFENGVLSISIPKAKEVKPKQIKVKTKNEVNAN